MALEIVSDNYEIFLILVGIIGFLMGFDRITEEDEEESTVLQVLAFVGGIILTVVIVFAILNEVEISKYTIVFSLFLGLAMIAKPFRKLPIAFALSAIVGLALTYYVLDSRSKGDESFVGGLSTKLLVIVILAVVGIVFLIGFIQEQAMDLMLWLLSWGIFVFIFSITIFLQGITLLLEVPDKDGLLGLLPG